jgi:hypothetical protein
MLVKLSTISKSSLTALAQQYITAIEDGNETAINIYVQAKALEELAKQVQSKTVEQARTEAERYGKDTPTPFGCKVELAETGTRYDFSHIASWASIQSDIDALKAAQKEIEELAKLACKQGRPLAVGDTGEFVEPAIKTSTSSIKVTIPK